MSRIEFSGPDREGDFVVNINGKGVGSFSPEDSYLYLDVRNRSGEITDRAKEQITEVEEAISNRFGHAPGNIDIERG